MLINTIDTIPSMTNTQAIHEMSEYTDRNIFGKTGQLYDEIFNDERSYTYTKTNRSINQTSESEKTINSIENKILAELEGTIIDFDDDEVSVKFINDVTVIFPKELFIKSDASLIRYGNTIVYQIKIDKNGFRYQNFEKKVIHHSEVDMELLELIDSL